MTDQQLFNANEVAKLLGTTETAIRMRVKRQQIAKVSWGKRGYRIPKDEVIRLLGRPQEAEG
jgi:excisionase family DNA binding protein